MLTRGDIQGINLDAVLMASRPRPPGQWSPWAVLLVERGGDGVHVFDPVMSLYCAGNLRESAAGDIAHSLAGYFWEES